MGICDGAFLYEMFFGWQNPCHISDPEFGGVHFTLKFYGDSSTGRGPIPKFGTILQNFILGNSVVTGKIPTFRQQKKFFLLRKKISNKICTSLVYFVKHNPLRSISTVNWGENVFWTLPVWVGESWSARKFGHARWLDHFTHEITLNDEYLSQFLPGRKILLMTLEHLFEIFIKISMFDCSRATCLLLRGQNRPLVPSGWGKARKRSKIS